MIEFTLNYILNGLPSFKMANSPTTSPPIPSETISTKNRTTKQPSSRNAQKSHPKNRSRKSFDQLEKFKKRLMNASKNPRYCAYCKNHGIYSLTLVHRNRCEFRDCVCLKCLSVRERYSINANVVRQKRAKVVDDFRAENPQYFQPTTTRKKESTSFDSIFQGDTECSQSAYRSLWNMIWTILTRFEFSMDVYPILYLILKEVSSDVDIVCQKIFQCKNELQIVMKKILEQGKEEAGDAPQLCLPSNDSAPPLFNPLTLPKKRRISCRAQMRGQTKRRAKKQSSNTEEDGLPSGNYQPTEPDSLATDDTSINCSRQPQGPAGNPVEEMNVVPPAGGPSCNSFVGEPLILGYDTPPLSVSSPDYIPLADGRERANSNPSITDDYQVEDGEGSLQQTFLNQTGSRMTAVFVEVTSIPGDEGSGHSPLTTHAASQRIGSYVDVSPVSVKGRGQHELSLRGGPQRIEGYSEATNQRDFIPYHGQGASAPFQSYPLFVQEIPTIQ